MKLLIVFALVAGAFAQDFVEGEIAADFNCPESYGDFEDYEYCDIFFRCEKGVAYLKQCENGHAYDPRLRGTIYPCDYAFSVNCTGRELLQDPSGGIDKECRRRHGIFPDDVHCGTYYICKDGIATRSECATGLHLSLDTMECVWPDVANRGPCDVPSKEGNFTCPPDALDAVDINGNREINPKYPKLDDCRFFYVCLNGISPGLRGCPEGTVFNDVTGKCDDPENVPGCERYYEEAA